MQIGDTVKFWRKRGGWVTAKLLAFDTLTTGKGKRKVTTEVAKLRPIGKAKSLTVPKEDVQPIS